MSSPNHLELQNNELANQSSAAPTVAPLSQRAARNKAVRDAVENKDWDTLAHLSSQPGGFQEARTIAWPFLLHATSTAVGLDEKIDRDDEHAEEKPHLEAPKPHRDERQVGLDTN
ncbi:hypothetical protein FRC09_007390, partial [Ceratobasidium sp. 395]